MSMTAKHEVRRGSRAVVSQPVQKKTRRLVVRPEVAALLERNFSERPDLWPNHTKSSPLMRLYTSIKAFFGSGK